MALQFIVGSPGSGKSTYVYDMIAKEAAEHRERQYFILVPDQFTLETQKTMVERSGGKGILNIDVLSFHRLAFRVFEQLPALQRTILEDMGKTMLLRKVFTEQKEHLTYFKRGIDKPGFLDECKSFLCELEQYGIGEERDLEKMAQLGGKFEDIQLIYRCFKEKLGDTYMMAEELIPQLTSVVHEMDGIQNSVICFDGFTGFTPTQYDLIRRLLELCDDMYVTMTTDITGKRKSIFRITEETMGSLTRIANEVPVEIREPVVTGIGEQKKPYRFLEDGELAFLERNLYVYSSAVWKKKTEELQLYIGQNPEDEAKYIASSIWWMVAKEGYRYEDIAVVTGSMNGYEDVIAREFSKMGISHFMDSKKNIGANWVAELIQSVLELLQRNMEYDSTFHYLRCGLSPLTQEEADILENYVLATGKRGFSSYDKEWKSNVGTYSLEEINALRQRVADSLRQLVQDFSGGVKTVGDFIRGLYAFLVRQNVYDRMLEQSEIFEEQGEDVLAKEYKSVYKIVMNLLDEMMDLMEHEEVSVEEFRQLLRAGISEGLVGFIPPKKNQVVVGDIERTRLKDIKVLFFAGFSDDIVPGGLPAPGIVNNRERRKIEDMGITLAPSGNKKVANDLYYLYLNMTKPSERLIFTYSENNTKGTGRQASYVLDKIRRLFPQLTVVRGKEDKSPERKLGTDKGLSHLIQGLVTEEYRRGDEKEIWWEIWRYYKEKEEAQWIRRALRENAQGKREHKLSKEALEQLYGESLYGSITRLERFAKCPYAYFLLYGLSLKEREEYQVSAPDLGNVVHKTLEKMNDMLTERKMRWRELDEKNIPEFVDESLEKIVEEYRDVLYRKSKRMEFMITRMKRMLYKTVWGISQQMKKGAFEQQYSEAKFSYNNNLPSMKIHLEDEKELLFNGVIDRIDTYEDDENVYLKVVDYKTGNVKLSLSSVFYGLQLQLVLYMSAALDMEQQRQGEKKVKPAGMMYCHVTDPTLTCKEQWVPDAELSDKQEAQLLEHYQGNGYVSRDEKVREKIDIDMDDKARTLSDKEWERVLQHTRKKVTEFGNEIMSGTIDVAPYQLGGENSCTYCKFHHICGMEGTDFYKRCRNLEEMTEEEALMKMQEQDEEGEDHGEGNEMDR